MKPRERVLNTCHCGNTYDTAGDKGECNDCTYIKYHGYFSHSLYEDRSASVRSIIKGLVYGVILIAISFPALASTPINPEKLCDAIYHAEGGAKTRHPYGILKKYKTTTPRQACINTVNSAKKRYRSDDKGLEFIPFLQRTYAPLNAKNDPSGLNKNWIKNVEYFYGIS